MRDKILSRVSLIIVLSTLFIVGNSRDNLKLPTHTEEQKKSNYYIKLVSSSSYNGIYPLDEELISTLKSTKNISIRKKNSLSLNLDTLTLSTMNTKERLLLNLPLDINSMTSEDFDLLPGIGPKIAQRIVEYREIKGNISHKELTNIHGIGEKKYAKIRPFFE